MYNVCYINEENELIKHENVTTSDVLQLVRGLNTSESLTIVNTGFDDKNDPIELLEACLEVVNTIPRTRVKSGHPFRDTYKLASVLTEYLGKYRRR
jgi:hypothetical protein